MANLQSTQITGSINFLEANESTGSLGNMWYNPYSSDLSISAKVLAGEGVWRSGIPPITPRCGYSGVGGSINDAMIMGGVECVYPPSPPSTPCTRFNYTSEKFNGVSWSIDAGLSVPRDIFVYNAFGTQNAAVVYTYAGCTEVYDGVSWQTTSANVGLCGNGAGTGIANAGITTGGSFPGGIFCNATKFFDGATWSTGPGFICKRDDHNIAGTQNATLIWAGITRNLPDPGQILNLTEEFDGTSWSAASSFPASFASQEGAAGSQNSALSFCKAQKYNGTSWSAISSMIFPRRTRGGGGTGEGAITFGPYTPTTPTYVSCTEIFSGENTLGYVNLCDLDKFFYSKCLFAWSAAGNLITGRSNLAGAGTQNEALAFGGYIQPTATSGVSCTEEYNGSSWSAGGALIQARYRLAGAGTQNSALGVGGNCLPANLSCTEEYDGTSWSAGTAYIFTLEGIGLTGTQNAAIAFGGFTQSIGSPGTRPQSYKYDGTTWTSGGNLINGVYFQTSAGTQNDALSVGGCLNPTQSKCTEEYNGSSWSTGGALITGRVLQAGGGNSFDAIVFGSGISEEYDGTSWSTGCCLIQSRNQLGGASTGAVLGTSLGFGGQVGPTQTNLNLTEEYSCININNLEQTL
jgi:hypothetical protein